MKPFTRTFTREKILRSWSKVGFCPFPRSCIKDNKVRHELGQALQDKALEDLHKSYTGVVSQADEEGLNAGIFDERIPVAKQVNRELDEDDQVKILVETKGSFSAGALWNVCGTRRIGNASVVLRAQTHYLALEENITASTLQSKLQRRAKLLVAAQQALLKYKNAPTTMKNKDWIDIIRWVLPESNADGLLKDLWKKDAISQKLLSLD
jgi:hypothetical protein